MKESTTVGERAQDTALVWLQEAVKELIESRARDVEATTPPIDVDRSR